MNISSITRLLIFNILLIVSPSPYASHNPATGEPIKITFSTEEQIWIKQNPVIMVAPDPHFPPFEFRDDKGKYSGISIDYLKLIEKRTGLKFEFVNKKSWTDVLTTFREGKTGLLSAIAKTPQRTTYMDFLAPHIVVPGVIITSKDYTSLQQLYGHRVAVVVNQVWDELITSRHFNVNLVRVKTIRDGIELASMGAVDAMVTDLASVTYFLKQEGIVNLRIVNYLEKKLELGLAIQKNQPVLKSILQKGMNSITHKEMENIHNKWIKIQTPGLWEYKQLWLGILAVFIFIVFLLVLILTWNNALRKRVEKRTRQLQATQLQLIQAEKMESIGRVATGIAHEVKNPLAIIQMGIEYLAYEIKQSENSGNQEILEDINQAVERADHIINSFLEYSREETLNLENININQVIKKAVTRLEAQFDSHNIECDLRLSAQIGEYQIDENKLQQAFINLLLNASDALENQQKKLIRIESCTGVLDDEDVKDVFPVGVFHAGDDALIIKISDSGAGISTSNTNKLFEPFFTSKNIGEGTGLGLPVSQKIVQMHQGAISIKNQQTGGTVVTILFHLHKKGEEL